MKTPNKYLLIAFLVACNADDMTSQPAPADFGGGTDAFGVGPVDATKVAALRDRAKTFIKPGTELQMEPRLGVPTFVWSKPALAVTPRARWVQQGVANPAVTAARDAVRNVAALYNLSDGDVTFAHVDHVHSRKNGPTIVKLKTDIGGIEVFREELNVLLDKNLSPVSLSGYISSPSTPPARAGAMDFQLSPSQATARALAHMTQASVDAAQIAPLGTRDTYDNFDVVPALGVKLADPIRVKKYYFHVPTGLEAAYYVEVSAYTGTLDANIEALDGTKPLESYGYLVSAATGQLLSRTNLIANETYRVWGDPASKFPDDSASGHGQHPKINPIPDGTQVGFVPTADVTLANFPFSQSATDPWLPAGATETNGNNVDAYVDLISGDGFGPATTITPTDFGAQDYRAQATGAGAFLHTQTPDVNAGTAEGRQASIQQLFYNNNFLHDWYYDAGFNETARNAQKNNFGRGGLGNDDIRAEAQDSSNLFNANMNTPADGGRPRMQMFMFPHPGNFLETTPTGKIAIGTAFQGAQQFSFTGQTIVPVTFDGTCTITNAAAIAGKVALIDRNFATCSIGTQLARVETSAAVASVIQNTGTTGITFFVGGPSPTLTKPIAVISNNNGLAIRAAAPPVSVNIQRFADRDGSLDQQIVFHEWMHYMSNRLVGNANGLVSLQGAGMGEGWGDTNAMALTVRAEDTAIPSNATFNGTYALATHATGGAPFTGTSDSLYFGIRRYPYSTDMTKNPLTFKHIQDGVALPAGIPVLANAGANSEVHNTGEVWAQMLWECYAGVLRDTQGATPRLTFNQAQDRWRAYLVGSLKATPVAPTILEARDALLAFMLASDVDDYIACRKAFAKRGAGAAATGPDRFSSNNTPVVEDFNVGPEALLESASFDDSLGSCDNDGVVDHGEYGKVTVTVRNAGITPLTNTTVDFATSSAGMWFPSGTQAVIPTIAVGQTGSASVRVALPPTSTGIQQVDFQVTATNVSLPAPLSGVASFRVDTDDVLASSATDDVEPNTSTWTRDFNPALPDLAPWFRGELTPLAHGLFVADPNGGADERVFSPVFTVNGSGNLTLSFEHQWAFEADGGGNYDGGVVEISVNGGAFVDLGNSATAGGYTGPLITYAGNLNPLAGRQAFVKSSAGVVTTTISRAIAPGSTVQVRFRMGSDNAGEGGGWLVDNIAFGGVVETPFATLIADPNACAVVPTSADLAITKTDGVTSVNVGGALTYTIVASNAGPGNVIGATVTDNFPADLTCTWTCAGASGGVCGSPSGSGSILDHPTLPTGGKTTYTASCTLAVTSSLLSLSNTATIANPGPVTDPNPANNSATDTDTVIRLPAHLTGTKTVAGTFTQGSTVTYTVILNNDGTGKQFDNATDEFTDVLPAGLTPQTASASSGTASLTGSTVHWNGALNAAGSVTITIVATINAAAGTTISNQGTFFYDNDGNGSNESSGVTDAFPCP
jgi:uncharacterized repeat protein (TIGR01451 family)